MPQLTANYEVGLYLPEQGFVANPGRLVKGLAAAFQRDGGVILQRKVLDIDIGPQGPRALLTDEGTLPVETLVICAGAHSNEFTARLGDNVPLEAERGYHVTYSDPRTTLPMPVFLPEHKFFVTPMEMGLRIAGQTEFAGIYAEPNYARADVLAKHMERLFPQHQHGGYDEVDGSAALDARLIAGHRPLDAFRECLLCVRTRTCGSGRRRTHRAHHRRSHCRARTRYRHHAVSRESILAYQVVSATGASALRGLENRFEHRDAVHLVAAGDGERAPLRDRVARSARAPRARCWSSET